MGDYKEKMLVKIREDVLELEKRADEIINRNKKDKLMPRCVIVFAILISSMAILCPATDW